MDYRVLDVKKFSAPSAAHLLPRLSTQDNKSTRGRVVLFAGSSNYQGAAVLAAKAALRAGSGYVTLAQYKPPVMALKNPDFILRDILENPQFSCDAVLVGPGFGVGAKTAAIICALQEQKIKKVILDADALTTCVNENLFPLPESWIVTPHSGELARILQCKVEDIENDRRAALKSAINICHSTVVLKGHGTLVGNARRNFKIASGNSALAKSGTGDVLAGIITSFRGQGLSSMAAASLGAYVHGRCADLWVAQGRDELSLVASDLLDLLPRVLHQIRSQVRSADS